MIKKKYIQYLRVISMLAVVAIHVSITALNVFPNNLNSVGGATLYLVIRNLFHFAVPVFFMISGALILTPSKKFSLKKLMKNYLLKYSVIIVEYGWTFALIEGIFTYKDVSVKVFIESFWNMLCGNSWAHMWYMYALLGVTLFIPVLRAITKEFGKKEAQYLLIVSFIFLSILPIVTEIFGFNFGVKFPMTSIYCVFMLLGYWIDSRMIIICRNTNIVVMIGSAFIIIGLSMIQQIMGISTEFLNTYSSPVIVIFSIMVFSYASSLEDKLSKSEVRPIIKKLENVSFGVYLVHMFWVNVIYKVIRFNPFNILPAFGFLLTWLSVVLLSIVTVIIMKKIPHIKKYI